MKIYFTASIVGKKHYLAQYQDIINQLTELGHTVVSDHIIKTTESQIKMETKEERQLFHKKLTHWISDSDCIIVEASFPSISVGYEISLALNRGKAVLVLHADGDPPSLLPELNNERLVIEKYDIHNLPSILHDFIIYASGSNETRFTFFLNHSQASYLHESAKRTGISKSAYIRNLLDRDAAQH